MPSAISEPTSESHAVQADKLETLTAQLSAAAKTLRNGIEPSKKEHEALVSTVRDTANAVHQPRDDLVDVNMAWCKAAAIRLLSKWKVFENIPDPGFITYQELAEKVGGDVVLINRVCWVLVAAGYLEQQGKDRVGHTSHSRTFATSNPLAALWMVMCDEYMHPLLTMPDYYEKYGIKEPTGRLHTIKAFNEGEPELTVAQIMSKHPKRTANMMLAMSAMEGSFPHTGFYDFSWIAEQAAKGDSERKLIVDVGGAKGWTLQSIVKDNGRIPMERCVLQDLPGVISMVEKVGDEDVKKATLMGIDFHKEQPVKGALVYMIRRCLRDFGDDECVSILEHIVDAMAPDSKLLIADTIATNPPSWFVAFIDFFMSTIGGKERTEEGFRNIAVRAGLSVTGVHYSDISEFAMIECVKA
ncbi:O-methyltransferase [Colletotrichum somersetense]|nr:O-methyltransferase [Colletotrichum somersetense]